ncbi:hypothetical protein BCR35DRAFT_310600 [Leucosporidium creatinivorum]|uniref:CsbD-like domain-containing protein n=1 Tax=Leucosporidium creatinivorum TaxID=106004 RepID=A0A1Y2D086_9BASI|nr:hypothetical protein BCR35DRAFT_310600 [Leucosporidium creatinivorum]
MSDNTTTEPSQINAQLSSAKGAVYEAIGSVSSDPSWQEEGAELKEAGEKELAEARAKAKGEASAERLGGKVESAFGMLTGNQETMKEGNLKAEKAEWKSSAAEGTVPLPSKERLVGKAESAFGMVTGDMEKQKEGNLRAEKAEWLKE